MLPTLLGGGARSSCPSESCQCIFSGCLPSLPPSRAGGLNPVALGVSWSSKLYSDAAWRDSDPECSFPSSPKAQSWSFPAAGCAPGAVGAGGLASPSLHRPGGRNADGGPEVVRGLNRGTCHPGMRSAGLHHWVALLPVPCDAADCDNGLSASDPPKPSTSSDQSAAIFCVLLISVQTSGTLSLRLGPIQNSLSIWHACG